MFLVATTNTLIAVLGGAPSAEWPIAVSYADLTATTFAGGQELSVTNSTTDVTICPAPAASTVRQIKSINAFNAGNAVGTLTISVDVSGTPTVLWSGIVPEGATLGWSQERGWTLGDSGAVSSVFGRIGAVTAQAGDYTASQVTNTPAGNIAATDVQDAIDELDTEKAGLALANSFSNAAGQAILMSGVPSAASVGGGVLQLQSSDAGATGAILNAYHNSASPAASDTLMSFQMWGSNTTPADVRYGIFRCTLVDPTAGSEDSLVSFFTQNAGSLAQRFAIGQGAYTPNATGGDQGADTINASNYFDDGVNINTLYVDVSGDTMTGPLVIDVASVLGLTQESDTSGAPSSLAAANTLLQTNDASVHGYNLFMYHNSASPAVSDNLGKFAQWGNNDAAAAVRYTQISGTPTSIAAGAEAALLLFSTVQAGSIATRVSVGNGLIVGAPTGGDQGAGTVNAINYFDDGVNINTLYVDVSGDTMTGPLQIDNSAFSLLTLNRIDDGNSGPRHILRHTSTTPAVSDGIGSVDFQGYDSAAVLQLSGRMSTIASNVTSGAYSAYCEVSNTQANAFGSRVRIAGGIYGASVSGGDPGQNNANFTSYLQAGANINTIYAALAGAAFTGAVTINVNTVFGLEVQRTDNANLGAGIKLKQLTTSPALNDYIGFMNVYGTDDAAAERLGGYFQFLVQDPAAATYAVIARFGGQWNASNEGTIIDVLNGVVVRDNGVSVTGSYMGGATINTRRYFKNGIDLTSQTTVATDVAFSLQVRVNNISIKHTGTLTANRLVTLSTTNAEDGDHFIITRTGAGAFNLDIGGLKNLATGQWCQVTFDGSAWYLSMFGSL